jgi:hypothetical protein
MNHPEVAQIDEAKAEKDRRQRRLDNVNHRVRYLTTLYFI